MIRYPVSVAAIDRRDVKALHDVVDSGRWTLGPRIADFEKRFAGKMGMRHAVMTNSGSSANLIATAALTFQSKGALRPGDEVIVPAIAWSTTYSPLHQYGLRIRVVDVDLETLTYDMAKLKRDISKRTRAIVAVGVLGNPCDLPGLSELCRRRGIILFEDNCECVGARSGGRFTGTYGLVNTFSFFFTHQISTIEGGMVLTDDHELYSLCKSLRSHGWTRDQDKHSRIFQKRTGDFFEAYRFVLPGYNLRPTEFSGGVGLSQLKRFDEMLKRRRANAKHFQRRFEGDARFIIQRERHGKSSWFSFTMIVHPEWDVPRARVLAALDRAGIEYRIITGSNILDHDVVRHYKLRTSGCPNAALAHRRGFFVGNGPKDLRREIDYLHKTLGSPL